MATSDDPVAASKMRLKSMQIFSVAATVLLSLVITIICIGITMRYEVETDVFYINSATYWQDNLPKEQHYWYEEGIMELEYALHMNRQKQTARNAIIFVVNGISSEALAAARFVNAGQPRAQILSWDKFPHVGRLKNSCSKADVCDLYTVATALFGGVRTNNRVGGLDAAVPFRNCSPALLQSPHRIQSIFEQAEDVNLRTGLVTNGRLTGPIAAALYAHTPDTSWECDETMPKGAIKAGCQDIAQQLLDSRINVLLGGGRQTLVTKVPATSWDPIDETVCKSKDGRNLMRDWQNRRLLQRQSFVAMKSAEELRRLNGTAVDYVLGVFANSDLSNSISKLNSNAGSVVPTMEDMLTKAMTVLERKQQGYLLLVESGVSTGSNVDVQINLLLEVNGIINRNAKLNNTSTEDDTLILLVFPRGNYAKYAIDGSIETEMTYDFHDIDGNDEMLDERFSSIHSETVVYAKGPQAYLFHGLHEEVYMSYVISHALNMGSFRNPYQ